MILLLDTSTPLCRFGLRDGEWRYDNEWRADRELAKELLRYLEEQLAMNEKTFSDITGIGVFRGPGSFTGLRIGLTVLNTFADAEKVPIVGATGEWWREEVLEKLSHGEDEKVILPFYGSDAIITKPRK